MTTTWYKLSRYGGIEPVEVVSDTPKFVIVLSSWLGEEQHRREAKVLDYRVIMPTKRECYAWLMSVRQDEIKSAKARLAEATDAMVKALAMAKKDGVDL